MRNQLLTTIALGVTLTGTALAQHNSSTWADSVRQEWIAHFEATPDAAYNTTAIMVRFEADRSEAYKADVRGLVGDGWLERFTLVPGLELIHVRGSITEAIARVRPFVLYAEPDYVFHPVTTTPNDPNFGLEWGLKNTGQVVNGDPGTANADIRATLAWDTFTGDANFVIADIDTGMQLDHPDLAANLWTNPGEIPANGIDDDGDGFIDDVRGWDFYSNDNDASDTSGHGTHTAGTIGARGNNAKGVSGVNWQCKIMPLRFLGPTGGTAAGAVGSIQFAVMKGVKVSNNSWTGPFDQGIYDAINAAKSIGHVFVAAAGNANANLDVNPNSGYPSAYDLDNILSVAATTNDDTRASFSNYGLTRVDLGAPGDNVYSTWISSGYAYDSGTSMAAPHVSGAVAMVYALNPSFTYQQVRFRIMSTTRPLPALAGLTVTGGILNLAEAIAPGSTMPGLGYCSGAVGDPTVSTPCPCANAGAPGNGCRNSSIMAGSRLLTSGSAALDTVVFTTSGEITGALSVVLQGDANAPAGIVFGDGVRCAAGNLKRLYTVNAIGGNMTAPTGTDPSVKTASAALGDTILPGSIRYYQVYYRDPNLVFCPAGFNATNAVQINW